VTLSIKDTQHNYAECHVLFIVTLIVVMLNVVMLNVVMLSVIMLSVIMMNAIMLSVVALSKGIFKSVFSLVSTLLRAIKLFFRCNLCFGR